MRDPRKNLADTLHYVDRRSIPSLQHRHQHAATSVLANDVRLWSESITDRRDIPKIDRGTAHRLNGQIVQFLNGFHIRVKVHVILKLAHLDRATGQNKVLRTQHREHIVGRKPLRLQ